MGLPRIIDVMVTSGSGSTIVQLGGVCVGFGVKPPNSVAVYDCEITDVDGFGIGLIDDGTGVASIEIYRQLYGEHTVAITNATVNGIYQIKIWYGD